MRFLVCARIRAHTYYCIFLEQHLGRGRIAHSILPRHAHGGPAPLPLLLLNTLVVASVPFPPVWMGRLTYALTSRCLKGPWARNRHSHVVLANSKCGKMIGSRYGLKSEVVYAEQGDIHSRQLPFSFPSGTK